MTFLYSISISVLLLFLNVGSLVTSDNLTCYQCIRQVNEECTEDELRQCPPGKDRCVTHITKDATNGFSLKRECGLGPCGFDDDMMNRGLGLDGCDRSKHEYFCLFCCRTKGCNKSTASKSIQSSFITTTIISTILIIKNIS